MSVFTVVVDEPEQLAGLSAARDAYNANPARDEDGKPIRYASDAAFVQHIVAEVAERYAQGSTQ